MNRRGFLKGLGGILLAGAAPAIVRADSLMRIVPRETTVFFSIDLAAGPDASAMAIVTKHNELARDMIAFCEYWARDAEGGLVRSLVANGNVVWIERGHERAPVIAYDQPGDVLRLPLGAFR